LITLRARSISTPRRSPEAGDTELAQRYDLVRQELAETIHLNETLGAPSERAMEKLFAAIEAEEARAPRRRPRRGHQRRVCPDHVAGREGS
jgi:hypothetical protein